jgi:undecaprenyl-diphosphatase
MVVLWALLLGGIALIVFEYFHRERPDAPRDARHMSYLQAVFIGLCQSLAIVPGVSRSAASIVGGLGTGLSRTAVVEFSFLLAVPTMLAASGLDMLKTAWAFSPEQFGMLGVGFVVSFFVALLSIKFLLAFVRTRTFVPFGVYRIVIALLFFFFILR